MVQTAGRKQAMELSLRYYGDPVLRERSQPVDTFDGSLGEFADALTETMQRERGIGLAAPQVGKSIRALVALQMTAPDDDAAAPVVVVNPVVRSRSKETWEFEEGCLSIPGVTGDVIRSERIELEYQDVEGGHHNLTAEGMFARILLHEIDHLDGRLFIDYLSPANKSLLKPRLREIAEQHRS